MTAITCGHLETVYVKGDGSPSPFFHGTGASAKTMTEHLSEIILTTERLTLKSIDDGDIIWVSELLNNFEIAKYLERVPHPYHHNDARDFISKVNAIPEDNYVFTISVESPVGVIGLHNMKDGWELGYWIGQPYWGHGFATEAAKAVTSFAFERIGINELVAGHYIDNAPSGKVLKKVGFQYTNTIESRDCLARGHQTGCHRLILTQEQWRHMQQAETTS